jgi:3'-phosphoadenosine 5'-phosphosulfate sulfotransferase (PAPS reductase)/FAD synthetase
MLLWEKYNPKDNWFWVLNYSGGKDSSLLLMTILDFLSAKEKGTENFLVLHQDTTIELPQVREFVLKVFEHIKKGGINTFLLSPEKNFFSLMLEKGYGFPRWCYRWCCRIYKYGRVRKLLKDLPQNRIVNLLAIRKDEKSRINGTWIHENKYYSKTVVTASPIIDLDMKEVWSILHKYYNDIFMELRSRFYLAKTDGLGCWACTIIREDPMTLIIDPYLYDLKIKLCKSRCAGLKHFVKTLDEALHERPDAFPNFYWPEKMLDIRCRGKNCGSCELRRSWRFKEIPKYLAMPCNEGKEMMHLVFPNKSFGRIIAEKIPGAEFHNDGLIICVPKTLKKSIEKIVKEVTT